MAFTLIVLCCSSCSNRFETVLLNKSLVYIGYKKESQPMILNFNTMESQPITVPGYDTKYINNICGYKHGDYYCSFESENENLLLKVKSGDVVSIFNLDSISGLTGEKKQHTSVKNVIKIEKYKNGVLFLISEIESESENRYLETPKTLYYTDFLNNVSTILTGITDFSVNNDKIYFYKYCETSEGDYFTSINNIYRYEDGTILEIFSPGSCPYYHIGGWKNDHVFLAAKGNWLVQYDINTKIEKKLFFTVGYQMYYEPMFVLPNHYLLAFASQIWYKQNPDIPYYYLYIFDLKSGKCMLIDENICNECMGSIDLI